MPEGGLFNKEGVLQQDIDVMVEFPITKDDKEIPVPLPPEEYKAKKKTPVVEEEKILVYPDEERKLEARANNQYGDDLLETNLSQEIESENNIKAVSKELFNKQNIALKTEVSHDEINNITRLRFLEEKFQIKNVSVLVNSLLELRVSKERKSRREFIDALQTENRSTNAGSFMSRFFGGGGGGPT